MKKYMYIFSIFCILTTLFFVDNRCFADETEMWSIGHYVDNFGEPTEKGYITNTNTIRGIFSNTATQDSKLNVRFLINNSQGIPSIFIQLYEYASNNPVKASYNDKTHWGIPYIVLIQDKNGKRKELIAMNRSDRLKIFHESDAQELHNVFMKGGTVKFRIIERGTPTTQYKFKIQNADGYNIVYEKLMK